MIEYFNEDCMTGMSRYPDNRVQDIFPILYEKRSGLKNYD